MLKQGQNLRQSQGLQQKLSPQQIQYIKLLQLPTIGLEQRVKEEMELNPVLEELPDEDLEILTEPEQDWDKQKESEQTAPDEQEVDPVDRNEDIDWESFMHNSEFNGNEGTSRGVSAYNEEWKDLPNPYHTTLLEDLEQQVSLLDLDETEQLIADQILGSLDNDGYFRREPEAVVDNIAFNQGVLCSVDDVERVRKLIRNLEPVGIASKDLQDCLLAQLQAVDRKNEIHKLAIRMIRDEWQAFERKHFDKLTYRLGAEEGQMKKVFEIIRGLDPKPGAQPNPDEESRQYIEPDFEIVYIPEDDSRIAGGDARDDTDENRGSFMIRLNQRNIPPLRISPSYKEMWDDLKKKKKSGGDAHTRTFIKDKIESAQWFIESIRQRQRTLMNTMRTIVELQEEFFKYGKGLRPMILKDVAERVNLDISTISRVVNGKYVQTQFGVYELKYFFTEGLETEDGEDVSSRVVKNLLERLIDDEDKNSPFSDQELTDMIQEQGYKVARRTVSKYREQLNLPVARLRRQLV